MWLSKEKYNSLVEKVCKVDREIGVTSASYYGGYGIKKDIKVLDRVFNNLAEQNCILANQDIELAEQLKIIKQHLGIKVSKVNQPGTVYKVEELDD